MSLDGLVFVVVALAALVIVGVVLEAWALITTRREEQAEEHEREAIRRRYGQPRW